MGSGSVEKNKGKGWGVVRYAAGSGCFPEDDCAAFDGWYFDRNDALAVYQAWCERHPYWIVGLVEAHEVRFSDSAWERIVSRDPSVRSICPLKKKRA
jgi:hypothetical protein